MKSTILNGLLLLAPLAVMIIILEKVFTFARLAAKPMERFFPLDRAVGVFVADVIAILFILFACYLIGLGARKAVFGGGLKRLDNIFFDVIPGYAVVKGVVTSATRAEDKSAALIPVLVRFDDFDQIAFEVERFEDRAILFLPGSPSAWSGSSVIVSLDRIQQLDMTFAQATGLLRKMGQGSLNLVPNVK
ncbi:hypothetical protein QEZ52_01085 [Aliisedimentitalea scapharcae]|uniref:DUF502 domain-containing protein n=1 Tax=Aliisedimentitalea scapharcae TaxID=1524259 RepID=A0ABZ2XWF3_9RHOB|nr:hypothetical protein K3727_00795 [Rhodobacteraceae bacterium M382]